MASVAIIAYLLSNPPEGEKPVTQAKADAPSKQSDAGAKPKPIGEKPPKRESRPETKPEVKPEPQSESEQSRPDPQPEPKPELKSEPKPEPRPEVVAESPEKTAERVKDAFAKAKTATDFRTAAIDALKLADQANSAGKQDVAKSAVTLALSAARKADDSELAKTATMCILEPGTKPIALDASAFDNREVNTADRAQARVLIPDAAAQEQALKLVKEVFKDKYSATTIEKQKALSQELLQKAKATTDDLAAQYVMLKEAGHFAIQAKDAEIALDVIREMGTRFDVDTFDLKTKALTAIGKSIGANEQSNAVVESLLALMEEAVMKEHYDTAKQLGTAAIDLARKSKDSVLLTVKARVTEVASIAKSYEQVKAELTTLNSIS